MFWIEVRPSLRRAGKPRLVPLGDAAKYRGFRSAFAFDDATKEIIEANGTTANLRGTDVYADTLFLDFDNHDPIDFRRYLSGSGLGYSEWTSGGRSVHFHVAVQPCFGFWVPLACKMWTKLHAPTADTSFLHATGMYRLPYTFHAKHAGRRKELVYSQEGAALILEQPPERFLAQSRTSVTPDLFYFLLTANKGPGQRSGHIWLLAVTAAESQIALTEALEQIRWWNSQQAVPQTDAVLVTQTENAYRRTASRHGG